MKKTDLSGAFARYCQLLALAEEYLAIGDIPAAVAVARTAVRFVFRSKCLFASPRLERLLGEIGRRIPTEPPSVPFGNRDGSRNVLHVLTHAQPIGGDSKFVWRWMQRDVHSRHSVAVTTQADVQQYWDIPEVFKEAAENSGGFVKALSAPSSRPLEQARELRRLCQGMDVVVLHLYPYDIIPVLALAAGCDSVKTLLVNHADHGFWVGGSVAHSVVHLRRQSEKFLKDRRALDSTRSSMLPIPLTHAPPVMSQVQAKRQLGYGPDTVLLLTIATPFKYSSPGQVGFLDLVLPVLSKHPQASLVAVGPDPKGDDWRSASIQMNGRVVAHGIRSDTDIFYAAADIYLDSVPFSSITSLLEAGSRGVPLLGCKMPDPELELLGPGAPGLENAMELASDPESYRALLSRLITDEAFRRQAGQRVQESILSLHTGAKWVSALNDVYEHVDEIPDRSCLISERDGLQSGALNQALVHLYSSVPSSARAYIRAFIGPLPYFSRLSVTWRLHLIGLDLCFLNLLPPPADTIARGGGRWIKKALGWLRRIR